MRHSNPFMIREFVRLLAEADQSDLPLPAEDDPELGPDVPPRDVVPGFEPKPARAAQRRLVTKPPPPPRTTKPEVGAPGSRENLVATLKSVSTGASSAMIDTIKDKQTGVKSSDFEMKQRAAVKKLAGDLNRIGQFSSAELWTLPPDDPAAQTAYLTLSGILKRMQRNLVEAGLLAVAPSAMDLAGALIESGAWARAEPLEISAEAAANSIAGTIFRELSGTSRGRKAQEGVLEDPAFKDRMRERLDAVADGLTANKDRFSLSTKIVDDETTSSLSVSSGQKSGNQTLSVKIPFAVAAMQLSNPGEISDFIALVDAALRDTDARLEAGAKMPQKPREVDVTGPDPEALAAVEELRKDFGDDEEEAIKNALKKYKDSNAMSEVKRQLGGWKVSVDKKTGQSRFVNTFDRSLKTDVIVNVVDAFFDRVKELTDLDPEEQEALDRLAQAYRTGGPDAKADVILKVLAAGGGKDSVLDYDQVAYSTIFTQTIDELVDEAVTEINDFAEAFAETDPGKSLGDVYGEVLKPGLEELGLEKLEDLAVDALLDSEIFQSYLQGLDTGDLEDELSALGISNASEAINAMRVDPKKDPGGTGKRVREILQVAATAGGAPETGIVNDLQNKPGSGPKFAGFMRALNTIFGAGFSPTIVRNMFGLPSTSSGRRPKKPGLTQDLDTIGLLALVYVSKIKASGKDKKRLEQFKSAMERAAAASSASA